MWENYLRIPNWMSISRGDVNRTILELELPKKSKVLDIGCGFGRISLFLRGHDSNVTAIDSYPKMVKAIKSRGINAILMNAENLKFKNNKFDLVFSDGLLEHFKKEDKIIRIIKEQVRVSRKYVLNFVPRDNFLNTILEKVQGVPKEYRSHNWVKLHKSAIPKRLIKKYSFYVKKLLRLDAYIIEKL